MNNSAETREDRVCVVCKGVCEDREKAQKCADQGFNPKFEPEGKALYRGAVVTIIERQTIQWSHAFIYKFSMLAEDNPGVPLIVNLWRYEDYLEERPVAHTCAQ